MRLGLAVSILIALASPAAADDTRVESYRTTIAVLDGIALGLAVPGAIAISSGEGGTRVLGIIATSVGGALYVFGAPVTHYMKQDKRDKYYGSMLMRVLGAGAIAAAGAKIGETRCADPEDCDATIAGLLIGAGIGVVASSVVDITLLAKRRVTVQPQPGGATIGVAGRF